MTILRKAFLLTCAATMFACLAIATAGASSPSAALTYRWNQPSFQRQALSLLAMNEDGTIRITDWTKARKLFGQDFSWAMGDLQSYNERVRAGRDTRMASIEELSHHAIVLTDDALAKAQATEQPGFIVASTAPYCRGGWIGACMGGVCCCGGWWFFCTQYCSCR